MRALVMVAVDAELAALVAALGGGEPVTFGPVAGVEVATPAGAVVIVAGGVGPAAAAATTSAVLAHNGFDVVLSMGIAGGFAGHAIGSVIVAPRTVAADLGCQLADRFLPLSEMGFGADSYDADPRWLALVTARAQSTGLVVQVGDIGTVSTVTGTAAGAATHAGRHACAGEAMEGFAVAEAASLYGVPFLEVRTVSNAVGPRDTSQWRIGDALRAAGAVVAAIFGEPAPW
jgi:futalosine hydrolase